MAKTACTLLSALVVIAFFHDLHTWVHAQSSANSQPNLIVTLPYDLYF